MSQVHESEIRNFIVATFLFGQGGDQIADGDSLLDKGVIDSTGVLELVNFIGEKFGIKVADEELTADNFDSIRKLAAFVQRKSV
jgi:acyl carrier protein